MTYTKNYILTQAERDYPSPVVQYIVDCNIRFWVAAANEICGHKASAGEIIECMDRFRLGDLATDEYSLELRNQAMMLMWGVSESVTNNPKFNLQELGLRQDKSLRDANNIAYGRLCKLAEMSEASV